MLLFIRLYYNWGIVYAHACSLKHYNLQAYEIIVACKPSKKFLLLEGDINQKPQEVLCTKRGIFKIIFFSD